MEAVDPPGRVAIAAAVAIGLATRSGAAGVELGAADRDLRRRALPTPRAETGIRADADPGALALGEVTP